MASGWSDLLEEARRQRAAGAPDPAALWRTFEELAAASPRAQVLELARQIGTLLSPELRVALAVVLGTLLEPMEWPTEWEQARKPLVEALEELSKQADPSTGDSLAATLRLGEDALLMNGASALMIGGFLLKMPCPRDQLRAAALVCRVGTTGCFTAFATRLRDLPPDVDRDAVQLARTRFEVAFQKYAQAARTMNAACGAVLFDGLDLRLEGAE